MRFVQEYSADVVQSPGSFTVSNKKSGYDLAVLYQNEHGEIQGDRLHGGFDKTYCKNPVCMYSTTYYRPANNAWSVTDQVWNERIGPLIKGGDLARNFIAEMEADTEAEYLDKRTAVKVFIAKLER